MGGKKEFSEEALEALKPRLEKIKRRFGSTTEDLAGVALNYVLSHPRVCCAIPGFRNARQARCNVAGAGRRLTADDLRFIRETLATE